MVKEMIAGIYRIDGPNGKVYIGSAVNIDERWRLHLVALRNNKHHSPHLQRAWNKYGEDAFTFSIVEVIPDGRVIESNGKRRLINIEQIWLDILFSSLEEHDIYNISPTAASSLGIKRTDEYRKRISESLKGKPNPFKGKTHSEESRIKMSEGRKGKLLSEETKCKMSMAAKGRIHSEEARRKMSEAHKGRPKSEEHKRKISEARRIQSNGSRD